MIIQAADRFIQKIRWRTHFYLNPQDTPVHKENYGFKSIRAPPITNDLKPFEDGILNLVQNVEFSHISNNFQKNLKKEVKNIQNEPNLIISADKTSNHYKMSPNSYKSLLDKNIQKEYKKVDQKNVAKVNNKHKELVCKLDIEERVFETSEKQAYITLKDHKDNFNNNPKCRLINPRKPEVGKISKNVLQKINLAVRTATGLTQWRNTLDVIKWFNQLKNKKTLKFINFDICEFYPSITPELLKKALNFAEKHTRISKVDKESIFEAKKCFLVSESNPWAKKN